MKKPLISIVILDFLKAQRVVKNVKSILKQEGNFETEIIVVDNSNNPTNASVLKPLEKYSEVRLIINSENQGYTKGNNTGAKYAQGKYIAIVNPDIEWVNKNTLQELLSYLEKHPEVGVVGPKQINPDHSIAMSVRAFPNLFVQVARRTFLRRLPILKQWVAYDEMQHLDYGKTQEVDWLQSSFVLLSKKLWDELGGFDERYFLFLADTELCWQAWKKGKKTVYYPKAVVAADGIRCSDGGFLSFFRGWVIRQHVKDSWRYTLKHWFESSPRKK